MAELNIEKMAQNVAEKVIAIVREEYISKADYENRLKADMVAILTELQLEINEKDKESTLDDYDCGYNTGIYVSGETIQQKINSLKSESEG